MKSWKHLWTLSIIVNTVESYLNDTVENAALEMERFAAKIAKFRPWKSETTKKYPETPRPFSPVHLTKRILSINKLDQNIENLQRAEILSGSWNLKPKKNFRPDNV